MEAEVGKMVAQRTKATMEEVNSILESNLKAMVKFQIKVNFVKH